MSNQQNDELQERTFELLVKLADVTNRDELALLCWHCGIASKDVIEVWQQDWEPHQRDGWAEKQVEQFELQQER